MSVQSYTVLFSTSILIIHYSVNSRQHDVCAIDNIDWTVTGHVPESIEAALDME